MFLLTIYERGKGEKGGVEGGKKGLSFFYRFFCKFIPMYIVSLYLCIWGGVKGLVFLLRFLLTIYGDFVSRPGRPPCRLACKPLCKLTLSGYGISYRCRRKGDHGALGLGGAVANPYRRLWMLSI